MTVEQIKKAILDRAQEFLRVNPTYSKLNNRNVVHVGWTPPPVGYIKLNTDGSAQGNPGIAGAGGIFRDHFGTWVTGFTKYVGRTTSLAAELWAIREGLQIAVNRGFSKLILETDSSVAKILLQSANHKLHSLGVLINDCRWLMTSFTDIQVLHIYREANAAADFLAKRGANVNCNYVLYNESPRELSFILFCDCIGTIVPRSVVAA